MEAGILTDVAQLMRLTTTRTETGGIKEEWANDRPLRCKILIKRASQSAGEAITVAVNAEAKIRYNVNFDSLLRLVYQNRTYSIIDALHYRDALETVLILEEIP